MLQLPPWFRILSNGPSASKDIGRMDLLAILQKSLGRAIFLSSFERKVRSSDFRCSTTVVHV